MQQRSLLCLALLGLLVFSGPACAAEEQASTEDDYQDEDTFRAQLLVHKDVDLPVGDLAYPLLVQGRNATVHITIQNVGTGTASKVVLTDSLPENAKLTDGSLTASFPKIAVGSVVKHSYVVVFTSGGSMDLAFLPQATVKYVAEEDEEQVGLSTKPGVFVLTPVQQITRYALIAGAYASLGICRTPTEWRNMAIVLAVLGSVLGVNWGVKTFKSTSTSSKRRKALQELEKTE